MVDTLNTCLFKRMFRDSLGAGHRPIGYYDNNGQLLCSIIAISHIVTTCILQLQESVVQLVLSLCCRNFAVIYRGYLSSHGHNFGPAQQKLTRFCELIANWVL